MIRYSDNGVVNVVEDLCLRSHMAIVLWDLTTEGAKGGKNDA